MLRPELFDEAIGELPASTVDVGAIVARQERNKAVRRGSVALLGATATVVALAFSVVAGLGQKAQPRTGQSAVGPWLAPSSAPVAESAEAKAVRVQAAWLRATASVLPQATWRAGHDGSFETPSRADHFDEVATSQPPPMFTRTNDASGSPILDENGRPLDPAKGPIDDHLYHAFGIVKVGTNEGRFTVRTLWRASPNHRPNSACSTGSGGVMTCSDDFTCINRAVCEQSAGPNGEVIRIVRETEQFPEYKLPYKSLWVWVRSADGTRTIEMTIENRAGGDRGPGPATAELALTQEQILRILLEPGFMI